MENWLIAAEPIVPVFSGMDETSLREDELLCGMCAEVLETQAGWLRLKTSYGIEGYVRNKNMVVPEKGWAAMPMRQVKSGFADVLSKPTVKAAVLMSLPRGSRVVVLNEKEGIQTGWCPVLLPKGIHGYMQMSRLMPLFNGRKWKEERLRERIVETARSYLGVSYRWGGKTPAGIDCSGLAFMCYWMYGIGIYRNAQLRNEYGMREILPEKAKPGDLLYFAGHVAMVLNSDTYIHATGRVGSDGVVINSLCPEDPRYRKDLRDMLVTAGTVF